MKEKVYLAAGGTGGHINAALSMGEYFKNRYEVKYFSGTRYLDYKLFDKLDVQHLDSKPLRTKNPIKLLVNVAINFQIFFKLLLVFIINRPKFVIGAGGYVCGPTLMSAWILGVPVFIIEQNAVMGLTNKLLSKIAKKIFVNFKETKGLENTKKVIRSGNPINNKIEFSSQEVEDGVLKILIFGGSLGAEQINEGIISLISKNQNFKLKIKHQVGKDKILENIIKSENVEYEQVEYIENMEMAYKWCNVIIARAGASTISELRVVKKPCLLIPYPLATDNHQFYNATLLKEESEFYVDVIDQSLYKEALADKIFEKIKFINENKLINKKINDLPRDNPNEIILKEIENVWNK